MSLPILFNEPLSGLQRWCEDLEYADLLDRAARCDDPAERLAYVAAFQISNYSTTMVRVNKPFNPILGETYECQRGQTVQVNTSFRGKDLDIYPLGVVHVRFAKRGNEHITFRKVTTCVRNVVVGRQWIDNYGESRVVNHTTGHYAVLAFKPYSFLSGSVADVEGKVMRKDGTPLFWIKGNWNKEAAIAKAESGPWKTVWTKSEQPEGAEHQYHFTKFAITLNEMEPGQDRHASPTDCRFRSDQRLFEEGQWDDAQNEKERLEDKQRAARRLREAAYAPLSRKTPLELWTFNHTYWKRRSAADWRGAPDLYSHSN